MKNDTTNYFITLKSGSFVIIKNVPCMKCTQCGEIWYNGTVVKQLEKITKLFEKSLSEISIVTYSDKIA